MRTYFVAMTAFAVFCLIASLSSTLRNPPRTPDPTCTGTSIDGHVGMIPVHLCLRGTR